MLTTDASQWDSSRPWQEVITLLLLEYLNRDFTHSFICSFSQPVVIKCPLWTEISVLSTLLLSCLVRWLDENYELVVVVVGG